MTLVSTNKTDKNTVQLEIKVGAEEFKPAVDRAYRKNAPKITVPGFRPGKAPRGMIEKTYGGFFMEEAVNELFPAAYESAVEEAAIEPVDKAEIEVKEVGEDGFTFVATVTVKPQVSISSYKGIKGSKKTASVKDEEVERTLKSLQERGARQITVEDRAAQLGDTATIDFEGFVDGEAFAGGKGEGFDLVLGSGQFIPGFEDQVVGHNVGEEFDVNVTFPEEYHAEELKGKAAVFKVKLHELKVKELPELDDEFAKDVSEFDTLAELKADIQAKLLERSQKQCDDEFENELVTGVIANMEADIPECMIERRIDEMVQDFGYRLQSQGLNLETYLKYTGSELESFRKTFREQAERHVRIRLALEEITKLENLTASEEEIEKEYARLAEMYGIEVAKVKEFIPTKDVAMDVAVNKAIDLIKENAEVTLVAGEEPAAQEPAAEEKPKKKTTRKTTKKAAAEAETAE